MSEKLDQISGKIRGTAGEVFDDSKLKAESIIQQGVDKIKEAAANIEEKADNVLKKGKERVGHLVDETKEKAENLINDTKNKF